MALPWPWLNSYPDKSFQPHSGWGLFFPQAPVLQVSKLLNFLLSSLFISFHSLPSEICKLLSCTCRPIASGDMNNLLFSYFAIQAVHCVCCGLHDPFNRLFPAPASHAGPLCYVRKGKLGRDPSIRERIERWERDWSWEMNEGTGCLLVS